MNALPTTADRVVAVLSGGWQGSGVVIAPRLVLTCAHLLAQGARPRVGHPVMGTQECRAIWTDSSLDAAVLHTSTTLLQGRLRMGQVETPRPLPGCEVIGFPDAQRYGADRHLDLDQFTGTILPAAGALRHVLVCDLDHPPATERADGTSPLAGLSGAPLFAGAILLGLVKEVPRERRQQRLECLPLGSVLASEGFQQACAPLASLAQPEPVTELHHKDQQYELDYAESVSATYRKTEVFGLDELNRRDSTWDLDTAYLSLEAQPKPTDAPWSGPPSADGTSRRIEALLASRPRTLIRGDAGAGKTTLVWWLAAHAATGTLGPELAELNNLVPFVVPLRTLRARAGAFPSPAQLPFAANLPIDQSPEGWAGRVLKAGRALLLVDGLDEVPQDDREEARRWLRDLLFRFPLTRCLATVRPLAVESDWLKSEGFEELRLLPMRDADIQAFLAAWHRAARLDGDTGEDLESLERELAQQFRQNPVLAELAQTPLLCAVICALHRLRQGFLPDTRWKLYRAALEMLLGNRDKRRKVGAAEDITLTVEDSTELLQRIAVWLVREAQSEFSKAQAVHQVQRALPGMAALNGQGTPDEVLKHLLNRSGLLQERSHELFQFAHRTFQDFLAAKEFVEDDHLNELIRHAGEQQWQDVILLAAGHCGRHAMSVLVNGLLDAGAQEESEATRTRIHVLAALCAQHAAYLDGATAERVRSGLAALLPPSAPELAPVLARLGPSVLGLLPPPEDSKRVPNAVNLICEIGGSAAIPYARAWAAAHPDTGPRFAYRWSDFPTEEYAQEVLTRIDLSQTMLALETSEQLTQLLRLPDARRLHFRGGLGNAQIQGALRERYVISLSLGDNHAVQDLSFLNGNAEHLQELDLTSCPRAWELAELDQLPHLNTLGLEVISSRGTDLPTLQKIPGLRALRLRRSAAIHLAYIPVHRGVTSLRVEAHGVGGLDRLDNWTSLTRLELFSSEATARPLATPPKQILAYARARPTITCLGLTMHSLKALSDEAALPAIGEVTLWLAEDVDDVSPLLSLFPSLVKLDLVQAGGRIEQADLAPLLNHPGLTVHINGTPVPRAPAA